MTLIDKTTFAPAAIWDAYADVGTPLCVTGTYPTGQARDDGYSVNLYFGKRGKLKGVLVFDGDEEEVVAVIGKVPASAQ